MTEESNLQDLYQSRRRVLSWAVGSRVSIMALMVLSDACIPDHFPGNGVLQIPSDRYCCDSGTAEHSCNIDDTCDASESSWYSPLLSPLTKWDAARFLSLAIDPSLRDPNTKACCAAAEIDNCLVPFEASEQAHAFFPLFPTLVRQVALSLHNIIPFRSFTFVNTVTLTAAIINLLAFLLAALALHDITFTKTTSLHLAEVTTMIFCINPASVFFITSYSEAVFCALLFIGHAQATRGHWHFATLSWMAASFTRSNGSMMAVWWFIQALATLLSSTSLSESKFYQIQTSSLYLILAILVLLPLWYHDQQGKARHCQHETILKPDWCAEEQMGSLYTHVQRKYWNVGFLHYYEWKQLPNFLLATPILLYGFTGAIVWIKTSWKTIVHTSQPSVSPISIMIWAWDALARSHSMTHNNNNHPLSLLAPHMLADYALLAMTCGVGFTVAHVQITTRLVCSSCPALYWFMAHLYSQNIQKNPCTLRTWIQGRQALIVYCVTFIFLGAVMHVNWLPWT